MHAVNVEDMIRLGVCALAIAVLCSPSLWGGACGVVLYLISVQFVASAVTTERPVAECVSSFAASNYFLVGP